ncbi:MAG TPA: NAD(P)H-hydrate dehydratase [Acidimicrobiales bacterium]|nr:NAD(P)H-hydrate dehydratase [Acidimicrobiales bacterium]
MRPVVTVAEMRAADAAALAHVDQAALVARAGTAVAFAALGLLGSGYGHRVVVVAGKGDNGADGRVAGAVLRRRGSRVTLLDAAAPGRLPPCDLVIDAAYGTGFRGSYTAPRVPDGARVLAVDVPSGVDGDTGSAPGRPMMADRTVTFAALKPGLLQGDGARLAGDVLVADIGVPVGSPAVNLVEDADVVASVPRRSAGAHKWATAVAVVAGSPGMEGAAALAARGASHAGAGMVRLAVPGVPADQPGPWPIEAVRLPLPGARWVDQVLEVLDRCKALVVGPGLGRGEETGEQVRRLIAGSPVPVVADADALFALGTAEEARSLLAGARPVVLTPHDGEYQRLAGEPPGPDRLAAARRLADRTGAVVLLKGSLTAVACPAIDADAHTAVDADTGADRRPGKVLLAAAGSPRLATAGTGDVLSGIVGALLARGVPAPAAAALGAHVHGRAADRGPAEGLVAEDLPALVAGWLSEHLGEPPVDGDDRG